MINLNDKITLDGYRLIIPSTCVGNVSQLTCDLLIESLKMEKIANIFHESIIPAIGGEPPFSHIKDPITTAAELYRDEATKLVVLQLRSPLAIPFMNDFFNQLRDFVQTKNLRETIILTSSYGYEKRFISGSNFWCKTNGIQVPDTVPQSTETKILGGGFAMKLYESFVASKIPTMILFSYVSEGDNIPDAVLQLNKMAEIFPVFGKDKEIKVQMPVSWKHMYGNRPPQEIY